MTSFCRYHSLTHSLTHSKHSSWDRDLQFLTINQLFSIQIFRESHGRYKTSWHTFPYPILAQCVRVIRKTTRYTSKISPIKAHFIGCGKSITSLILETYADGLFNGILVSVHVLCLYMPRVYSCVMSMWYMCSIYVYYVPVYVLCPVCNYVLFPNVFRVYMTDLSMNSVCVLAVFIYALYMSVYVLHPRMCYFYACVLSGQ